MRATWSTDLFVQQNTVRTRVLMIKMRRGIPSPIPIQMGIKSLSGVVSSGDMGVGFGAVTVSIASGDTDPVTEGTGAVREWPGGPANHKGFG